VALLPTDNTAALVAALPSGEGHFGRTVGLAVEAALGERGGSFRSFAESTITW
jgi:hypothetical protein